jgi:glycosidase
MKSFAIGRSDMLRAAMAWLLLLFALIATPASAAQHPHQEWTRNASIYEVNIRQYTPEGTISAFEKHLPRLKKMGVKILWIMPVQPIGKLNRKGTMGSYYSIADYTAVNPEFGTDVDFKQMVKAAHGLGMKVVLDWVANHTAWDHPWITAHPAWYKRDAKGEIVAYNYDNGREIEYWTDVVGLDYRVPAVWDAQIAAMKYWVREHDIDGFRADVASLMPIPFWQRARAELEAIKPMFMLAESNDPAIHAAFDMTYDWALLDVFADISDGKADAAALRQWVENGQAGFPPDSYRMTFTSNHDVNSWRWSDNEKYGPRSRAFAVLAATLPGMPLVYSGQESGLDKKIAFFEKDAIAWRQYSNASFYRKLLRLKARHPALANGKAGGAVELLDAGDPRVFAFRRVKGKRYVTVAANISGQPISIKPLAGLKEQTIGPWGYAMVSR